MTLLATEVPLQSVLPWRDLYRQEMSCQIIHDSIHSRKGWSREYQLFVGPVAAGYGSVAVAGPWKDTPTAYEFFVMPPYRDRSFDLFDAFLAAAQFVALETQSNDPFMAVMIHQYGRDVKTESILFHDRVTTRHPPPEGVVFRPERPGDGIEGGGPPDWRYVLDAGGAAGAVGAGGAVAASGGLLWHYNRPYGDIFMEVAEPFRRRGLGAYLVQELKRVTYERGGVPACRCNTDNVASRKTLQKAGFVPCGHVLNARLASARR